MPDDEEEEEEEEEEEVKAKVEEGEDTMMKDAGEQPEEEEQDEGKEDGVETAETDIQTVIEEFKEKFGDIEVDFTSGDGESGKRILKVRLAKLRLEFSSFLTHPGASRLHCLHLPISFSQSISLCLRSQHPPTRLTLHRMLDGSFLPPS
jgi:hypothetical protein